MRRSKWGTDLEGSTGGIAVNNNFLLMFTDMMYGRVTYKRLVTRKFFNITLVAIDAKIGTKLYNSIFSLFRCSISGFKIFDPGKIRVKYAYLDIAIWI